MPYIRPRSVQIVAVACLIPTALKDIVTAIPGAVSDFAHEVKDEMHERKLMADMFTREN